MISPSDWQDTLGNRLFIPKKLGARSAKAFITKVLEREDSKLGKDSEGTNESHVIRYITLIRFQTEGKFITHVGRTRETIVVKVANESHFPPYQIRLQMAQNIWATRVLASNNEVPDHARVDIKDLN